MASASKCGIRYQVPLAAWKGYMDRWLDMLWRQANA